MSVTSALVLYAMTWWMCFLIALPIGIKTQGDADEIEPGTHASAPQTHNIGKKALITTFVALVIWAGLLAVILSGMISISELEWLNREIPLE